MSNAQILCGKLKNRALRAPVRDLFDVAVAARRDPRALTIAANAMPEQVFRKFKKIWAENRTNYGFEQSMRGSARPHLNYKLIIGCQYRQEMGKLPNLQTVNG